MSGPVTITLPGRTVTVHCPSVAALCNYFERRLHHPRSTSEWIDGMTPEEFAAYARQFIIARARETASHPLDVLADIQAQEPTP